MRAHEAQKGESHMKQTAMLTTASLLSILLMTFHLTSDILFKMAPAGLSNLFAVFIFVVLLCGTLLLARRRAGYIIIFFGSVLALGITATFSIILSARALWSLPWRRSRRASTAA